jgi:non-reducing end alpha-L-arabinofuranosidase
LQSTITLLAATPAGSNNIKVANMTDLNIGQKIIIETGANSEITVINAIGTTGGTTVGTITQAGTKFIPVASVEGFSAGQTITIDTDSNNETAVVAAVTGGRRRFVPRGTTPVDTITITSPLTKSHSVGAQVSGSGITLATPLKKAHNNGVQVANYLPTPGAPNQYIRKPK